MLIETIIMSVCTLIITILTIRLIFVHKQLIRVYREYVDATIEMNKTIQKQEHARNEAKEPRKRIITPN